MSVIYTTLNLAFCDMQGYWSTYSIALC